MVLTVSFALSLVTGLSCHHRLADHPTKLDASVGASGPHDFAVRFMRRSSARRQSVHRIPPHVRDDRETPLCRDGTESKYSCFYPAVKQISEIPKLTKVRSGYFSSSFRGERAP